MTVTDFVFYISSEESFGELSPSSGYFNNMNLATNINYRIVSNYHKHN